MNEESKWRTGSRNTRPLKRPTNRPKLSFWRNDNYKSAKLETNYGEKEKLYTFDNPNYQNDDIQDSQDSDDNQRNTYGTRNGTSLKPNNCFELKNRNNSSNQLSGEESNKLDFELNKNDSLIEYLNYQIQENDSLQSIALRYGCTVSKIKQINHLITDQEFYGLRLLKLPVKKFGILSDVLIHQVNSCSLLDSDNFDYNTTDSNEFELQKPRTNSLTVNIGISQHLNRTNSEDAFKFLNHMDNDLKKIRESTKTVIESSNVNSLDQNSIPLNENDYEIYEPTKVKKKCLLVM